MRSIFNSYYFYFTMASILYTLNGVPFEYTYTYVSLYTYIHIYEALHRHSNGHGQTSLDGAKMDQSHSSPSIMGLYPNLINCINRANYGTNVRKMNSKGILSFTDVGNVSQLCPPHWLTSYPFKINDVSDTFQLASLACPVILPRPPWVGTKGDAVIHDFGCEQEMR